MTKTLSSRLIFLLTLFLLSTGCFIALAIEVVLEKEDQFDRHVISFLEAHDSPFIDKVFNGLTFFGSIGFLASAFFGLALYLFIIKRKKDAAGVALTAIASTVLLELLKFIFKRSRPEMPVFDKLSSYSFPSGHSFHSFIFYSVVALLIWKTGFSKKWKTVLSVLLGIVVLSIGLSRILLRYHYASDVAGGFCLGISCISAYLIFRTIRPAKQAGFLKKNG
ncbi:MAG: phosphatase PAP2 family protein [Chitinophagaceae bacterium]